jgi:hypothetical protein
MTDKFKTPPFHQISRQKGPFSSDFISKTPPTTSKITSKKCGSQKNIPAKLKKICKNKFFQVSKIP